MPKEEPPPANPKSEIQTFLEITTVVFWMAEKSLKCHVGRARVYLEYEKVSHQRLLNHLGKVICP